MILSLFRRPRQADTVSILYGMIVAQARLSVFYRDYAVPDTVNGRFDLLVLHLALVLRRLRRDSAMPDESGRTGLPQALFDSFCQDMDGNLREMGIADLKVPKEMRRIGEAFYGRAQAYDQALDSTAAGGLARVIARNIYEADTVSPVAKRLANYAASAAMALEQLSSASIAGGELAFPAPDDVTH